MGIEEEKALRLRKWCWSTLGPFDTEGEATAAGPTVLTGKMVVFQVDGQWYVKASKVDWRAHWKWEAERAAQVLKR